VTEISPAVLPSHVTEQIDHWIQKYPAEQKQSAVLPALHIVQDNMGGYLTPELMAAVAKYLDMPEVAVLEVATFYSMYYHKKAGKHKIDVCTNISCMLKGSQEILKHFENRLNIKPGETTPDGKFSLRKVECLGACVGAPMCQIDKNYHENLTPEKIDKILGGLE